MLGNNGAKNAGSYIIYAIVEATENYNGWQGQVHVNIAKGDPANFIFFNSYQTDYSSYYQDIFVAIIPLSLAQAWLPYSMKTGRWRWWNMYIII